MAHNARPRDWNRLQRCGIGGEGETGAFKCLTRSTLSPAPDAGPFFESRSGTPPGGPPPIWRYLIHGRGWRGLRVNEYTPWPWCPFVTEITCMSSEHFGQLAWQFKRMSGSSGLKVQAAIAC